MSAERDLFGDPVNEAKPRKQNGYAARPGSGPAGETCRTCKYFARVQHAKVYLKCSKIQHAWTAGMGTDILAKAPACSFWEKPIDY